MVGRAPAARNTPLQRFPTAFPLTALLPRNYSFHMAEHDKSSNLDLELKRLEKRIEELVATVHRLKEENRALRARQDSLASEKTTVMNRSEQVRARVEAMIGRHKAMERTA